MMKKFTKMATVESELFVKTDHAKQSFPSFEMIRRQGKLCDVTLKVGDQKFSAHRIVLASSVPYFYAMFTHDMVESTQSEITMQGIDGSALESLVNFAYTGKVQIDSANVQSLLVGASFLQLQDVRDACCDFLTKRLNVGNVLAVRTFADQFACATLVDTAEKYIQKNFSEVMKTDDFYNMSVNDIIDIISRDELHVSTEEEVFNAVMTWVKKDKTERLNHLPELLSRVRLPLLTPQVLADRVASEEIVKTCLKCRDLLDEAKDYHLMPERRSLLQTFKTRPRCCTDVVGVIYAIGGLTSSGDPLRSVECYDPIVGRWQLVEPMNMVRSRAGVSVLNGCLFAIGGFNGREGLDSVEVYDPSKRKWKGAAPMIKRRSALGAAVLDGKLYVCGGYDGVSSLSSVERYDPEANLWSLTKDMRRHRSAAGVCVFGGRIYVIGGHDGLSIFDSVESYNNLTDTWTEVSPMLTKRCRLGVASLNGKLYAAGGYDGHSFLKSVECFDPISNQWTYIGNMNVKRSRVALVTNCGYLYAIGGYDGASDLTTVEMFDPELNVWTYVAPMCAHEGGVGATVIPTAPSS